MANSRSPGSRPPRLACSRCRSVHTPVIPTEATGACHPGRLQAGVHFLDSRVRGNDKQRTCPRTVIPEGGSRGVQGQKPPHPPSRFAPATPVRHSCVLQAGIQEKRQGCMRHCWTPARKRAGGAGFPRRRVSATGCFAWMNSSPFVMPAPVCPMKDGRRRRSDGPCRPENSRAKRARSKGGNDKQRTCPRTRNIFP